MSEASKGVIAMLAACAIWGLVALYYALLVHVPPIEILAHRTLWSFIFFACVLAAQGRLSMLKQALTGRNSILVIGFAALMISANWFLFITSVQIGKVVEASLGYYIFPLVVVLLGAIVLRERLARAQKLAVALAALAVVTLTIGLGVAPWISLFLATTFGLYGLVKKKLDVGPVVSVTSEVLLLCPIALVVLGWIHAGEGGAFGSSLADSALLAFSGFLTAFPLILLSYAAKRVSLSTLGILQYVNPTLQFLVATMVFKEAFSQWHAIAFAMIWTALVIYSVAAWRQDEAMRNPSHNS